MNPQEFEPKLSAILSADVAGYSRLMGVDDDPTVRTLTGHREMMSAILNVRGFQNYYSKTDYSGAEYVQDIQ